MLWEHQEDENVLTLKAYYSMLSVYKQALEEICRLMFRNFRKTQYNTNKDEKLQEQPHVVSPFVLCGGVTTLVLDESSMGLHTMYDTSQKWLFSDIKHDFELWSAHF